ncbi:hypothetical protein LDENG_00153710 [Lucifuga dentata]|nr:hypothetical protein LDENG_00153710 [Lucifuga dentata]
MLRRRGEMDEEVEGNRAVLLSVAEFDPGVNLSRRLGAQRDTKELHRTLSKLGFRVDIYNDLSGDKIYELFKNESQQPVRECFLAVLSSHGEEGCVFGADGKPVWLSHIFSYFNNTNMERKAKVFLIQACRGSNLDDGVEVDSTGDSTDEGFSQYQSVPVDAAVMYATTAGYGAFMHPCGSVFLQTFCSLLEEKGNRNLELTRLMTRLSHRITYTFQAKGRVLGGKKEMPCLVSRMTREVFPFADPGQKEPGAKGSQGLSAMSLLSTENSRTRTLSIS